MRCINKSVLSAVALIALVFSTAADAGRTFPGIANNSGVVCTQRGDLWLTRNRAYGQLSTRCGTRAGLYHNMKLQKQGDIWSTRGRGWKSANGASTVSAKSSVQCIGNRRSLWGMRTTTDIYTYFNGANIFYKNWTSINNLNCS